MKNKDDKARKKLEKTRKRFLKLRKNHEWVTVLMFLIISFVAATSVTMFAAVFTGFSVNAAIENQYEAKKMLADIYEGGVASEGYKLFDEADMDYFIRSENGEIIHSKGEITCSEQGAFYDMPYTDEDDRQYILMYPDTQYSVILPDENGGVDIDFMKLAQDIHRNISSDENKEVKSREIIMELPVWMTIDLSSGEDLVFKAVVPIKEGSVALVLVMVGFMAVLIGVILLLMIVHSIIAAVDQGRVNKLFYTDIKINANNWMWFIAHADHRLNMFGSAKKGFAFVDLEFTGYRRYCACRSIRDGEMKLSEIYTKLRSLLSGGELCAHSAEDRFALLMYYDSEEDMRKRLEGIISSLGEGGTQFRAGVYPLPAVRGAGYLTRRRNVDIERDYNNACAACSSIVSASGIAFYDEKFVEEQRWEDTVAQVQQIAVDGEEFVVYYQPKYDPATHMLRGAEALIRWDSPVYGFLSPYKFIPIFEKNGFVTEIDHYMLTHVARDQKRWLDMGLKCVPVSVNVSRAHFIEPDLAEQIRDMVDREGAPRELIEIELTESAFFDDKNAIINVINKLKSYGFKVSMDDFGSGYSSLNSLKDMPLDVLKLDADFFRGKEADTDRGAIVVGEAIKLAKSLNMLTVAEGIEERKQVEFLAEQGCDMIQGYAFAKPMTGADYEERMIEGRSELAEDRGVKVQLPPEKEPIPIKREDDEQPKTFPAG